MNARCVPDRFDFVDVGRGLEIEAVWQGRRENEFSTAPVATLVPGGGTGDDEGVAFRPLDDIQGTAEAVRAIERYVPFAEQAFAQRGLLYPFMAVPGSDRLGIRPGGETLARDCAALASIAGMGGANAKEFEKRAVKALHRFVGGWAVLVGAPRDDRTGTRRAVTRFRALARAECGRYVRERYPPGGDFKVDAFFILGREWGGPLVFVQAKNSGFDRDRFAGDLLVASSAFEEWFGRKLDKSRRVIPVIAVNSVFTQEAKEAVFEDCLGSEGYHILDSADILCAESGSYRRKRDSLVIM